MNAAEQARLLEVLDQFGPALQRLARSYEENAAQRADLVQEIYVALARALPNFEERSSLRTFVYRVAHNVAATHVLRAKRGSVRWVTIDDLVEEPVDPEPCADVVVERKRRLERLSGLVSQLKPLDRQLTLLYLEGLPPEEMADVTGLSITNVTTKLSRIRAALTRSLGAGERRRGGS
jgi:RNA polymerase sigma-70 factor, ECF subfamily